MSYRTFFHKRSLVFGVPVSLMPQMWALRLPAMMHRCVDYPVVYLHSRVPRHTETVIGISFIPGLSKPHISMNKFKFLFAVKHYHIYALYYIYTVTL